MRRNPNPIHGLLVVDKPLGCSSMDVVRVVRRAAEWTKTGHAGTLDPLATGVVICCLGKGTKAVEQLMGQTKIYQTTVNLAAFTNTDDAEGQPQPVEVTTPPTVEQVRQALDELTGQIKQTPPAYSAIKINGQRAYKLARKGETVEMPSRIVRIDHIELVHYQWPNLELVITCGKGTYIRSLGRQIGEKLNTGGYLTALRRTAVGDYTIDRAVKLDEVPTPLLQDHLLPIPLISTPDM